MSILSVIKILMGMNGCVFAAVPSKICSLLHCQVPFYFQVFTMKVVAAVCVAIVIIAFQANADIGG